MTQAQPASCDPGRRPPAVTVLAVLGLVLGVMALFEASMAWPILRLEAGDTEVPLRYRPFTAIPWLLATMKAEVGVRLALAAALVVSSAGLLSLRPWARRLALGWGSASIVDSIAGTVLTIAVYLPELVRLSGAAGADPVEAGAAKYDVYAGLPGTVCVHLVHPVALVVVLSRRAVRDAFSAEAAPTA